jgi:hypothetical protein
MDLDPNLVIQKLRGLVNLSFVLPAVLRDSETGQINWSNVVTGALTAGLIASGSSLFALNAKVAELSLLAQQRGAYIEQLPVLATRQQHVLDRLEKLEEGKTAATNERFRKSDGDQLRTDLERRIAIEIARTEARIDRELMKGYKK